MNGLARALTSLTLLLFLGTQVAAQKSAEEARKAHRLTASQVTAIKQNMRTLDHMLTIWTANGFELPLAINKSFFTKMDRKATTIGFLNPATKELELPVIGSHTSLASAQAAIHDVIGKGRLEYTPIVKKGRVYSYLIRGGHPGDGTPVVEFDGQALVLQGFGF